MLPDELIDELLARARTEQEIAGPGGLLGQLTKRLVERAMEVELTDRLGYEPHQELRKALKTKGSFPSEDAARKLIYLAIHNAVPQWTKTRGWTKALLAVKIQFGDRLPN